MKSHSPSKGSLLENSKYQATVETTIAEFNKVSLKPAKNTFCAESPFRIRLPEYFNIPTFQDCNIFSGASTKQNKLGLVAGKEDIVFKKRMKDLGILVEGMKRAKNIKQESRYYFTQGVLLHNAGQYLKSIELFEKFLKIVIYLQDTKSVELCLNVIGCAYMYLRNYDKAIQFHKKQGNVSDTSDKYYSLVNIGLCAELAGATKEAYNKYNQALQTIESEQPESKRERAQALETLLQRVSAKMNADEVFVTENLASKSPSKAIHSSFIKEESSLLMKKVASRKEYQQAKLSFAISSAEQNIQEHLKSSANYTLFN